MQKQHLGYFDAFRGIAVAGVVLTHIIWICGTVPSWLDNIIHFGSKGVQLFFIVSGFTLTYNYDYHRLDKFSFYVKRYFRIAPMYYFAAIFYAVAGATIMPSLAPENGSLFSWITTLTFTNGWFPATMNSFVPGGWSIAAEMTFYIFFPLMLILKNRKFTILAMTASSFLISVITYKIIEKGLGGGTAAQSFAYFFWIVQIPAFLCGICIGTWLPWLQKFREYGNLIFFASLAGLCVASLTRGPTSSYIMADILFTGLVIGGSLSDNLVTRSRVLQNMGTVSFSIYLTHFTFIRLFQAFFPNAPEILGPTDTALIAYPTVLILSVILANVTYQIIERNGQKLGSRCISFARAKTLAKT